MKIYLIPVGAVVAAVLWAMPFGPACAADSTFNVDSYIPQKFTDFQLRLDGGLHMEGERTESKLNSEDGAVLGEHAESYDVQELRGAVAADYRYETIPRFLNWSLLFMVYGTNQNGAYEYRSDWASQFDKNAQSTIEAGQYLVSDAFLSFMAAGTWYYRSLTGVNTTGYDRRYSGAGELLPGWGRMYEGEYAATGMYIIKELRDDGILNREPDYEEMLTLAEFIHHYRQTHAVDERLHKIETLTRIMEYLQEIEAIESTGPYGYLSIQDVWDYFPTFSRRFGWRFRVGAGMEYGYSSNDYTVERKVDGHSTSHIYRHYRTTNQVPYMTAKLEWRRPFGMRWQMDLEENGRYFLNRRKKNEGVDVNYISGSVQSYETISEYTADGELSLAGTVRYIIDSRSNARATLTYNFLHYHSQDRGPLRKDIDNKTLQIAGILEYRLAVPTTLTVELDYTDWNRENITTYEEEIDYHHYLLTVGVTHYLF